MEPSRSPPFSSYIFFRRDGEIGPPFRPRTPFSLRSVFFGGEGPAFSGLPTPRFRFVSSRLAIEPSSHRLFVAAFPPALFLSHVFILSTSLLMFPTLSPPSPTLYPLSPLYPCRSLLSSCSHPSLFFSLHLILLPRYSLSALSLSLLTALHLSLLSSEHLLSSSRVPPFFRVAPTNQSAPSILVFYPQLSHSAPTPTHIFLLSSTLSPSIFSLSLFCPTTILPPLHLPFSSSHSLYAVTFPSFNCSIFSSPPPLLLESVSSLVPLYYRCFCVPTCLFLSLPRSAFTLPLSLVHSPSRVSAYFHVSPKSLLPFSLFLFPLALWLPSFLYFC